VFLSAGKALYTPVIYSNIALVIFPWWLKCLPTAPIYSNHLSLLLQCPQSTNETWALEMRREYLLRYSDGFSYPPSFSLSETMEVWVERCNRDWLWQHQNEGNEYPNEEMPAMLRCSNCTSYLALRERSLSWGENSPNNWNTSMFSTKLKIHSKTSVFVSNKQPQLCTPFDQSITPGLPMRQAEELVLFHGFKKKY